MLLNCHVGCTQETIVVALGLTMADLYERRNGGPRTEPPPRREAVFEIRDTGGRVVAHHHRIDLGPGDKKMWWRLPGAKENGLNNLHTADLPLYGSEFLSDLSAGSTIVLVEGEPARDALNSVGVPAVGTVTGASGTPSDAVLETLDGYDVVLWPDNDTAGLEHMTRIAGRLAALGEVPRRVTWPDAPPKGDAADFIRPGSSQDDVDALIRSALAWQPGPTETPKAVAPVSAPEPAWPDPLAPEAFYGLPGEIVTSIEPYSEASRPALLAHVLSGIGAFLGPHVRAIAGDAEHPAKLNTICVGVSSKSRKGSSQRPIERVLLAADPTFSVVEGLSSGEGLIWQVRDPISRPERVGKGAERKTEVVEVDAGVADKRLWVVESEFASPLRIAERDGNTLSPVIRRAWDRSDLKIMTKNSPATATGAHITIAGHITREELLRYLDRTELGNGYANRFLFFASNRGRVLPDGEGVPPSVIDGLAAKVRAALEWAQTPRLLRRDEEASAVWHDVYEQLSEGKLGMSGAATSRAESQVLRVSVLYATLDRSDWIRAEHLLAGLAVWRYCEQSALWIFGDATGDPTADTILSALRRNGPMSRSDIVDLFGRNASKPRLDRALGLLLTAGRAKSWKEDTGGHRPAEMWAAT